MPNDMDEPHLWESVVVPIKFSDFNRFEYNERLRDARPIIIRGFHLTQEQKEVVTGRPSNALTNRLQ